MIEIASDTQGEFLIAFKGQIVYDSAQNEKRLEYWLQNKPGVRSKIGGL